MPLGRKGLLKKVVQQGRREFGARSVQQYVRANGASSAKSMNAKLGKGPTTCLGKTLRQSQGTQLATFSNNPYADLGMVLMETPSRVSSNHRLTWGWQVNTST